MRRSNSFFIALAAAVLTAGSLYALAGPRHFGRYGYRNGWHNECRYFDSTDRAGRWQRERARQPMPPDSTTRY